MPVFRSVCWCFICLNLVLAYAAITLQLRLDIQCELVQPAAWHLQLPGQQPRSRRHRRTRSQLLCDEAAHRLVRR